MKTRPVTSKPRGQCCYYNQPRGCFSNKCKFLHGESEKLTLYDKSKTCRYFDNGYCRRGDKCWFVHATSLVEAQQRSSDDHVCCICLEKPTTYGLLSGCNHIFCVNCIKHWRDPTGKTGDVVHSGVTKKCPLCRSASRFITPSSRFFEQGDPMKEEAIEQYKKSMERVPCRYFQQSKLTKPFCPFGSDCFYQHRYDDGTPHIFKEGVDRCMKKYYLRRHRNAAPGLDPQAIYGMWAALLNEQEQQLAELNDGDAGGRRDVEEVAEDGGVEAGTRDAEEEVMAWVADLEGLLVDEEASEEAGEDLWSEELSGSTSTTPTGMIWTTSDDLLEGPSGEPPFVTDGRGRVVGSSCITL